MSRSQFRYSNPFSAILLKQPGSQMDFYDWDAKENEQGFCVLQEAVGCLLESDDDYVITVRGARPRLRRQPLFEVAIPFEFSAAGFETRGGYTETIVSTGKPGNQVTFIVMPGSRLYIVLEQVALPTLGVSTCSSRYPRQEDFYLNNLKTTEELNTTLGTGGSVPCFAVEGPPKFEVTDITKLATDGSSPVFRIRALRSLAGRVVAGELGGWVASESNLSHDKECWIADDAEVTGNALVSENAIVKGHARVLGSALVKGDAIVAGEVVIEAGEVWGKTEIDGSGILNGRSFGSAGKQREVVVLNGGWVKQNYLDYLHKPAPTA